MTPPTEAEGDRPSSPGHRLPGGRLDPVAVGVALAFLAALGLRDKVPFLAARAEIYGSMMIVFLFPLAT